MSKIVRRAVADGMSCCAADVLFPNEADSEEYCTGKICPLCACGTAWKGLEPIPLGSIVTERADGTVTVEVPK